MALYNFYEGSICAMPFKMSIALIEFLFKQENRDMKRLNELLKDPADTYCRAGNESQCSSIIIYSLCHPLWPHLSSRSNICSLLDYILM